MLTSADPLSDAMADACGEVRRRVVWVVFVGHHPRLLLLECYVVGVPEEGGGVGVGDLFHVIIKMIIRRLARRLLQGKTLAKQPNFALLDHHKFHQKIENKNKFVGLLYEFAEIVGQVLASTLNTEGHGRPGQGHQAADRVPARVPQNHPAHDGNPEKQEGSPQDGALLLLRGHSLHGAHVTTVLVLLP